MPLEQLPLFYNNFDCFCVEINSSGMFISCLLKYTYIMYTFFMILHVSDFDLHLLLLGFYDGC